VATLTRVHRESREIFAASRQLTVQLAAAAAAQGLSVLVIDADPAAGASRILTGHRPAPEAGAETGEGIVAAAWAGVDLVPAEHVSALLVAARFADPSALPRAVTRWGEGYELVLIDTPAGVGPLLLAAAADDALVLLATATRQAVAGHYWTGYLWQTCEDAAVPLCQPSLPQADALAEVARYGCPVAELGTRKAQALAGLFVRYLGQLAPGLARP